MPKVTIDPVKGLHITPGSGVVVNSQGLEGVVNSEKKSAIDTGAHNVDFTLVQPAETVLVDLGVVATVATAGAANLVVSAGETAGGQQYCANADFVSSNVAAVGSSIQVASAAQGEGNASISFADAAALYTATARNIVIRVAISATNTAGELASFIKYLKV